MKSILTLALIGLLSINYSQNTALHFDSLTTHVQTTYPGIPGGTQARTIEAWIKTTSNHNPTGGGKQGVIADYGSFTTGGRFTFNVLWSNAIRLEVGGHGVSGTIAVNDGNWHHVAVVYDPTATNKYSLYVDSILDVSGNTTVSTNTGSLTNFRIGRRVDGAGGFRGSIDEVRVYNYARTQAQIGGERFAEYCTLPTGMVAYYKFNEGTAGATSPGDTIATDYAGTNNGKLIGFSLTGTTSNWVAGPAITAGSTVNSNSITACGSYTTPGGTVITMPGTYNDTMTGASGCDSIESYIVTFPPAIIRNTVNDSGCVNYTTPMGTLVTTTGTYYDTVSTGSGCDTTIRYNIVISGAVDDSVYRVGSRITSFDTWADHQWVRCDSNFKPIPGATNRFYNATAAGDYAVIVKRGNCVDTSACVNISLNDIVQYNPELSFNIYPNPTESNLNIIAGNNVKINSITIIDVTGKTAKTITNSFRSIDVSMLSKGMYFIKIETDHGTATKRFIKN